MQNIVTERVERTKHDVASRRIKLMAKNTGKVQKVTDDLQAVRDAKCHEEYIEGGLRPGFPQYVKSKPIAD